MYMNLLFIIIYNYSKLELVFYKSTSELKIEKIGMY